MALISSIYRFLKPMGGILPYDIRAWIYNFSVRTSQIRQFKSQVGKTSNVSDWFDMVVAQKALMPIQHKGEIVKLIEFLRQETTIETICEIGTSRGGTVLLFLQAFSPEATVVTVDIDNPSSKRIPFQMAKQPNQKFTLLEADSHSEETAKLVSNIIQPKMLDFLFIDGDHSYEGVKRDFELYSPLVRKGGFIAFHDVVQDYAVARGLSSDSVSGEVPRFWHELTQRYSTLEFIDNADQDGFGIGVVRWG